jgi:NTP pyrophosphatase (non-canonical NTP hydrolase)
MSDPKDEKALVARLHKLAVRQRAKLRANRGHEWRDCTSSEMLARLREEVDELARALRDGSHADLVWGEAADVANFAAMVADTYERGERRRKGGTR